MDNKRIAIHTLGCKLNFSESSTIMKGLRSHGYETVDFKEDADVYVIHTCMVTAQAEKKCRAAIRQAKKRNPGSTVVVMGCYAQLRGQDISAMPEADIILDNNRKYELPKHLDQFLTHKEKIRGPAVKTSELGYFPAFSSGDRTRSFLKIQDGCDYYCSYCTIPYARGRSRSLTISGTMDIARQAAATGAREIILTGVNIGDFGKQNGEKLIDLMREMDKLEGIERIRISSIEPDLLSAEIIEFTAESKKFAPHYHLPLQSGCNRILKLMNRRYDTAIFEDKVESILKSMPHACIAVDVITGFPGESEKDYLETKDFLEKLDISYLHVFTYSARPDTRAWMMEEQIPVFVRRGRTRELQELSDIKKEAFYRKNIGRTVDVLFESDRRKGFMHGFSENYIKVKTKYNTGLVNRIIPVMLRDIDDDRVFIHQ